MEQFQYQAEREAGLMRESMDGDHGNPENVLNHMTELIKLLLNRVRSAVGENLIPVFVMRGGMMMWTPYHEIFPPGPAGLVVPFRDHYSHDQQPHIAYGNVPRSESSAYLILDPIVNSGNTAVAVIRAMQKIANPRCRIILAAVYCTQAGVDAIHSQDANVEIYALWDNMTVGPDMRLVGVRFDAGDCAFGGSDDRFHWVGRPKP
jgi:uracil phosphoribosyltransferase